MILKNNMSFQDDNYKTMFASVLGYLNTMMIEDYQDLDKIRTTNPTIIECEQSGRYLNI